MTDEPNVWLSYTPAEGNGTLVTINASHDATEDDVRRAVAAYPDGVESAVQTFREMKVRHPTNP